MNFKIPTLSRNIIFQVIGVLPRFIIVFGGPYVFESGVIESVLLALVVIDIGAIAMDLGRNQALLGGVWMGSVNWMYSIIGYSLSALVIAILFDLNLIVCLICSGLFQQMQRFTLTALRDEQWWKYLLLVSFTYPFILMIWFLIEDIDFYFGLLILGGIFFIDCYRVAEKKSFDLLKGGLVGLSVIFAGVSQKLDAVIAHEYLSSDIFVDVVQFNSLLGILYLASRIISNSSMITGNRLFHGSGIKNKPLFFVFWIILWSAYFVAGWVFNNELILSSGVETAIFLGLVIMIIPIRELLAIELRNGNSIPSFIFSSSTALSLALVYFFYYSGLFHGDAIILEVYIFPRIIMLAVGYLSINKLTKVS